jgi:hypothetical protein
MSRIPIVVIDPMPHIGGEFRHLLLPKFDGTRPPGFPPYPRSPKG